MLTSAAMMTLPHVRTETVTCNTGELRAAGAYRGYMMFEVTYNGTNANSHIVIDPNAMP